MTRYLYAQLTDDEILRLIRELHREDGATTVTANDGTKVTLINVSKGAQS